MRKRKLLIVLLCILVVPMLATCCLCSVLTSSMFFPQRGTSYTTSQQVNLYIALARQDAIDAGIPPGLFVRQIDRESGFDPRALSPSGAEGIAQFMPKTAASLGIDPWNPVAALKGAAQLMAHYTKMFAGTYAKALATYNAGLGTVQHALKVCGEVHWMNCLPVETQQYIAVISG
jgi:hypothetical protein